MEGVKPSAYTEEEWLVEQLIWESGHICSDCGEELHLTDEVCLIQAIYVGYDEHGQLNHFILNSEDGGYLHEPQFLHEMCWQAMWEDFWNEHGCRDPHVDPEPHLQVAKCHGCSAGIRVHELSALLSTGELRCSKRLPDGDNTLYFDACGTPPEVICADCLVRFNEDIFEMWENINTGTCDQGIMDRCWRYGVCQYGCRYSRAAE